jgi:DNA-binding protein H-NS
MSNETLLNRQFTEREVQRMRNIVTKKTNDRTHIQAGYESHVKRNEGDTWDENGKTWTIKNGIKRSVPKLSKFKSVNVMPLTCPQCSESLVRDSHYVKHIFKLMHKCPKCVAREESDLKIQGKFDEYAKKMYAQNHLHILEQTEKEFDDFVNHGFEKFMSESGEIETWDGKGLTPEQIKETKQWIADQKAKITTYLS